MCALFSLWVALQPHPCIFSLAWMIYMYSIGGSVMGVIGPLVFNGASRNLSLLSWTAYCVIVASCIIVLLQVVYFIVSATFLCRKNDYDKYINKRMEPLPLPPNADTQPVDPSYNYNLVMGSMTMAGTGGVYSMMALNTVSNRVEPNYFNQQPRLYY